MQRKILFIIFIFVKTLCVLGQNDSTAFFNADWEITELGKGAISIHTQVDMFNSTQSICIIKYPAKRFRSDIIHRPGKDADVLSRIGEDSGSLIAVNGSFFNVKEKYPSVYFRQGKKILSHTHPKEVYRVNGVVGFKDRKGKKICITSCDTTQYDQATRKWHTAMASGPLLIAGGKIIVPKIMGNPKATEIENTKEENEKIKTLYSTSQFYDKRHPRTAIGYDDKGYIYYIVIDGRFNGRADGASIYETAYICSMLGLTDAINLDGGGSSTLWSAKTGVLNHPYDNKKFDHKGERIIPNLFIAY